MDNKRTDIPPQSSDEALARTGEGVIGLVGAVHELDTGRVRFPD